MNNKIHFGELIQNLSYGGYLTLCLVSSLVAASLSRPQSVELSTSFLSASQLSTSPASKKNCWALRDSSNFLARSTALSLSSLQASLSCWQRFSICKTMGYSLKQHIIGEIVHKTDTIEIQENPQTQKIQNKPAWIQDDSHQLKLDLRRGYDQSLADALLFLTRVSCASCTQTAPDEGYFLMCQMQQGACVHESTPTQQPAQIQICENGDFLQELPSAHERELLTRQTCNNQMKSEITYCETRYNWVNNCITCFFKKILSSGGRSSHLLLLTIFACF